MMSEATTQPAGPRAIPYLDLGERSPVALLESHREAAERLIAAGGQLLPGPLVPVLDRLSQRWAVRTQIPYLDEVAAAAAQLPTGTWFMNLCFEWGCTTGIARDPHRPGMRMLRTLDWPFHGLGRHLVLARHRAPAGDYINVTWPGFIGVVTAMAPRRFALAINQAPMRRRPYLPMPADWLANRLDVWRSYDLPPTLLARRVVERCRSYAEARELLETTPIALPTIFCLAGTAAGEGCVIERTEQQAWVYDAPVAAANHWRTPSLEGRPRGINSPRRLRMMNGLCRNGVHGLDWVISPVANLETRVAFVANPAAGYLLVQGWEADGPVTAPFELSLAEAA